MSCISWCDYEGTLPPKYDPDSRLVEWDITLATFSNWFRNEVLGIFAGNPPTIPNQCYVAVHSTLSSSATPGTELSGDGYLRTPISFVRASDIKYWNPTGVATPGATAEWPIVYSFSIWDNAAIGSGNYYAYGNLTVPVSIAASKAIIWAAERVLIGLGSAIT